MICGSRRITGSWIQRAPMEGFWRHLHVGSSTPIKKGSRRLYGKNERLQGRRERKVIRYGKPLPHSCFLWEMLLGNRGVILSYKRISMKKCFSGASDRLPEILTRRLVYNPSFLDTYRTSRETHKIRPGIGWQTLKTPRIPSVITVPSWVFLRYRNSLFILKHLSPVRQQ